MSKRREHAVLPTHEQVKEAFFEKGGHLHWRKNGSNRIAVGARAGTKTTGGEIQVGFMNRQIMHWILLDFYRTGTWPLNRKGEMPHNVIKHEQFSARKAEANRSKYQGHTTKVTPITLPDDTVTTEGEVPAIDQRLRPNTYWEMRALINEQMMEKMFSMFASIMPQSLQHHADQLHDNYATAINNLIDQTLEEEKK